MNGAFRFSEITALASRGQGCSARQNLQGGSSNDPVELRSIDAVMREPLANCLAPLQRQRPVLTATASLQYI